MNKKRDLIIKEMREQKFTLRYIGKLFNISHQRVQQICSGYRSKWEKPPFHRNRLRDAEKYFIEKRDNFKCRVCGKKGKWRGRILVVHHLDHSGNLEVQNNDPSNLVTLCGKCHLRYHKKQRKYPEYKLKIKPIITRKGDKVMRISKL